MHYKRYEARSLKEALARVREELGPNALIVSSRSLKPGTAQSHGVGNRFEVTAASEAPREKGTTSYAEAVHPVPAVGKGFEDVNAPDPVMRAFPSSETSRHVQDIGAEGRSLSFILSQLGFDAALLDLYKRFEEHRVDSRISLSLLEKIRTAVSATGQPADYRAVLTLLRSLLKEHIATVTPGTAGGQGPTVISMVGPTGVGKTTTLAKLAARFALEEKRKVALATLDTYRIAAVEQLKVYANVMDLPLRVIHRAEDITRLMEDFRDFDLILMDTAGRSPNHDGHLMDLKKSLEGHPNFVNYLLVTAGIQEPDMIRTVERFSAVDLAGLIFTKLDECTRFGAMFNMAFRSRLPLVCFTTGQKVPDDMEAAHIDGILKRVFRSL